MDKKNLFDKGINRCFMYNFFKKHITLSIESMECMTKNGKCKEPITKSNCVFIRKEVFKMSKDNKTSLEIRDFILKNMC